MDVPGDGLPHCAEHSHFVEGCLVCGRAVANSQPYPVKKMAPLSRSFGRTGEITASMFRDPPGSYRGAGSEVEPEEAVSLSLAAIRFILRLIWPFSRII